MINFFKYSFDQKGWLMAICVAIIGPILLSLFYIYFPSLKEQERLHISKNEVNIEQNIYHKTMTDAERDCLSGTDESMIYLDYHTNMLGLDADVDPRTIFDTAVWGIALSSCFSNVHSEKKSLFILRVLAASGNCGGTWKAYSETARTFLESYIGDNLVIVEDTLSICARQTPPST